MIMGLRMAKHTVFLFFWFFLHSFISAQWVAYARYSPLCFAGWTVIYSGSSLIERQRSNTFNVWRISSILLMRSVRPCMLCVQPSRGLSSQGEWNNNAKPAQFWKHPQTTQIIDYREEHPYVLWLGLWAGAYDSFWLVTTIPLVSIKLLVVMFLLILSIPYVVGGGSLCNRWFTSLRNSTTSFKYIPLLSMLFFWFWSFSIFFICLFFYMLIRI